MVELVVNGNDWYFSLWRNNQRKGGNRRLGILLATSKTFISANQERLDSKPIAFGPVLEWSE